MEKFKEFNRPFTDKHLINENGLLSIRNNDVFLYDIFDIIFKRGEIISGVYLISFGGYYYIGKTDNLRKRLLKHSREAIRKEHFNADFYRLFWLNFEQDNKLGVYLLSNNTALESIFIDKYRSNGANLLNKT